MNRRHHSKRRRTPHPRNRPLIALFLFHPSIRITLKISTMRTRSISKKTLTDYFDDDDGIKNEYIDLKKKDQEREQERDGIDIIKELLNK